MLSNPQIFIWLLLITAAIYWSLPAQLSVIRAWVLILTSVIFIFTVAPYAVLCVFIATVFLVLISRKCVLQQDPSKIVFITIVLLLIAFSVARQMSDDLGLLLSLGLTFSLLRAISLLVNSIRTARSPSFTDALLYMLFFPLYSSGPIEKVDSLTSSQLTNSFDGKVFIQGWMRFAFGLFKVSYVAAVIVAPWVSDLGEQIYRETYDGGLGGALIFSLTSLFFVYLNFSGYSDIAIGAGAIYGLKIRENFNYPFLAKNIIEFWQRWHMSLGAWITSYLYMPLIRNYGKVYTSIFVAFVIIGLWHDYSINYLVWGIGHGLALSLTQKFKRSKKVSQKVVAANDNELSISQLCKKNALSTISCLLTISYVSILSTFANSGSLQNGLLYLRQLLTY